MKGRPITSQTQFKVRAYISDPLQCFHLSFFLFLGVVFYYELIEKIINETDKAMRMQPPSVALHCYAFKAQFIIKSRFGSQVYASINMIFKKFLNISLAYLNDSLICRRYIFGFLNLNFVLGALSFESFDSSNI